MKANCNIIKDLLPLYVDGMTSKESTQFIDEHLAECDHCQELLDSMKEEISVSSIDEKEAIKSFAKKLKKKNFFAIISSILIILILIATLHLFHKQDFIKKYEESLITVTEQENWELIATINTINYRDCQLILKQNDDDTVDVYITLFQSLKDKVYPTKDAKSIGCIPLCWKNFIDENIDFNWLWENNRGKIIFHTHNDIKIANIYYLETNEQFKYILKGGLEPVDSNFDRINIWKNSNLPPVFPKYWSPSEITTIDIEQSNTTAKDATTKRATVSKGDVYPNTEGLSPMLDIINTFNNLSFQDESCDGAADYYFKINTPEKQNVYTYGLEMHENEYHITTVVDGNKKEAILSPTYQQWMNDVIRNYFSK